MLRRLALVATFLLILAGLGGYLSSDAGADQVALVQGSVVNLRGGAGTSHPVVGQVLQGARLPVLGKSGDWVQVRQATGQPAWIAGWLVRVEESAPAAQPEPQPAPTDQVAVVSGDLVNLRGGAGTSHPVVGQVLQGARLPVLGKSGDWVQVRQATGQPAWIAGWLVRYETVTSAPQPTSTAPTPTPGGSEQPAPTPDTPAEQTINGKAVVRVDAVDIRSHPGNHYAAIAQATRGFKLPLVAQQGDWYQVKLPNGNLGWVESGAVELERELELETPGSSPSRGDERGDGTIETEVSGDRVIITVKSSEPMTYTAFKLPAPDRVVIDIEDFSEDQLPDQVLISSVVSRIRTGITDGQFRIACDLKRDLKQTRFKTDLSRDRRTLMVEIYTVDNTMEERIVVIDPGHGGSEPGAVGPSGVLEKDVNLPIALEVTRLLRQEGVQVVLTRTTDRFVELEARARMANEAGAEIFVSIHANGNVNRSKHGTSTHYWPYPDVMAPGQMAARETLARSLQNAVVRELGRNDLGLFQDRFAVLRATNMASVLVEVAFLTNPEEERLLADRDFQNRAAKAIVEGIRDYFQTY